MIQNMATALWYLNSSYDFKRLPNRAEVFLNLLRPQVEAQTIDLMENVSNLGPLLYSAFTNDALMSQEIVDFLLPIHPEVFFSMDQEHQHQSLLKPRSLLKAMIEALKNVEVNSSFFGSLQHIELFSIVGGLLKAAPKNWMSHPENRSIFELLLASPPYSDSNQALYQEKTNVIDFLILECGFSLVDDKLPPIQQYNLGLTIKNIKYWNKFIEDGGDPYLRTEQKLALWERLYLKNKGSSFEKELEQWANQFSPETLKRLPLLKQHIQLNNNIEGISWSTGKMRSYVKDHLEELKEQETIYGEGAMMMLAKKGHDALTLLSSPPKYAPLLKKRDHKDRTIYPYWFLGSSSGASFENILNVVPLEKGSMGLFQQMILLRKELEDPNLEVGTAFLCARGGVVYKKLSELAKSDPQILWGGTDQECQEAENFLVWILNKEANARTRNHWQSSSISEKRIQSGLAVLQEIDFDQSNIKVSPLMATVFLYNTLAMEQRWGKKALPVKSIDYWIDRGANWSCFSQESQWIKSLAEPEWDENSLLSVKTKMESYELKKEMEQVNCCPVVRTQRRM